VCFTTYSFFVDVMPKVLINCGMYVAQIIVAIGLWIVFNIFFNYVRCAWVGPGHPPEYLDEERKALSIDDPEIRDRKNGQIFRWCDKCNRVKPMRAHHCTLCNACVLKMDHHCPWVNNCVGYRNHKHFLLFLYYLWLGSGFYLMCAPTDTWHALMGMPMSQSHLIGAVLAFSAWCASFCFLAWSAFLLLTNQSTIEFYANCFEGTNRHGNPFNLGALRNFREVFGLHSTFWTWALPSRAPPPGDGIIYPQSYRPSLYPDDFAA